MAEALPQLDPAADETDTGAPASGSLDSTERTAAAPDGQPRARKTPEDIIKGLQSENDRVKSRFGKLLSSGYAKELGADGIIRALEQFEAVVRNPDVAKQLQGGALVQGLDGAWVYKPVANQKAAQVDADAGMGGEYEDPGIKSLRESLESKIENLTMQMNTQRQRGEASLAAGGQQRVGDFVKKFLTEYPLSTEERAEFGEAISSDIQSLDPTMLLKLDYEQFKRRVALPNAEPFLPAALARKAKTNGSHLAGLATDAGTPGSQGADTRPAQQKPMSWQQLQRATAAAALRAATEPA